MKLRLLMLVASAVLFLAPRAAGAMGMDGLPDTGTSGRVLMQQNANESAQATTDMSLGEAAQGTDSRTQAVRNVSYGGVAGGQSESGGRQSQPCGSGPQCRIYFGQ
ncbi:hypothetical protein LMG28614_03526 [Paraburkholderia ultramafica]|uniref:Uncharacterized protein n=1 Tax=Paraburkholderia ultramafica TaxID=1544867 RepID=A0A6S7BLE4_9BURK|nr:hypothetical protein [Paraburkholderia ultramafica]CAB3792423.1 hypothetical protein LMG28614_03526 [Paraburkholderia ultramafica]